MKRVQWVVWVIGFGLLAALALAGCGGGGGGDGPDPGPGPDPGFPDVRGVYTGPGTSTNTECVFPENEGTIDTFVNANVFFQDGTLFRMIINTSSVFGSTNNQLESNINEAGEWQILLADAIPPGVVQGTFSGDMLTATVLFPKTETNLCNTEIMYTVEQQ